MTVAPLSLEEIDAEIARRREGRSVQEDAAKMAASYPLFVRSAWQWIVPARRIDTWHIDSICEHVQAAYERQIPRLLITVPPGYLKSTLVNVMAPAWRWINNPQERIVSASHADHLSVRDTTASRKLILTDWYQTYFGTAFDLARDENMKTRYSNTVGGYRVATHVGGGTGERGGVLVLDDAHNAREVQSAVMLAEAREWWGDTWASRLNASAEDEGVKIVIGQRIHEDDVIGFILDGDPDGDRWTHLCLPVRYDPKHPFVYPERTFTKDGRSLQGDVRLVEGDLLAPLVMNEVLLDEVTHDMTEGVKQAQYQQNPVPREGAILKRKYWQYYPREMSFYAERSRFDRAAAARLGRFDRIVHSWDTSLKDRAKSDRIAGQVWGAQGGNRYLLRLFNEQASFNATVQMMEELYDWAADLWPDNAHNIVVESASNGPDAIAELKKRLSGVVGWDAKGTKVMRADAASPALEGGNCFLPGEQNERKDDYGPRTPTPIQAFVNETAKWTGRDGERDDQVDAWSQAMNYLRKRGSTKALVGVPQGQL